MARWLNEFQPKPKERGMIDMETSAKEPHTHGV